MKGLSPKGTVPLRKGQRGYLLITVVVALFLLATVALLLTHDSSISANTASTELETARAEYVAQAGMQNALWRAQNNACMGDVTIPSTSLGADSYTATITGAAAGTLHTLSADQDAWIRSDQPTNNMGGNLTLHIKDSQIEQPLYRFDLSSLPAGAQINSAVASFYVSGEHPEGPVTVHRITTGWSEADATWDSISGSVDSGVLATISAQPSAGVWVRINLTAQVQAWVNGEPNNGILLASTAPGIHAQYVSREGAAGEHPRLDVVVGSGPASPVNIQATGTLDNGVTRTLSRPITAAYQPPGTVTLQLGTDPGADAMLDSFYPRNYGGADYLQVNSNAGWLQRPVLRFDLGGIPAHTAVLSARLELNVMSVATPGAATVHRVTRAWLEGTKSGGGTADGASWDTYDGTNNWTTAGGDFNAAAVAETAIDPSDTWVAWEIGPLVEQWLAGAPNDGLLIKSDGTLREARFAARENSNTGVQPKLTITYACECGTSCMSAQGSGNILMVVRNATNMWFYDTQKRAILESWGYTVNIIDDDASAAEFDAGIAANDVAYISEPVTAANIDTKLTNAAIGVIGDEGRMNDYLGIATSYATPVLGSAINVTDTTHYITQVFPAGSLEIYSADMEGLTVAGDEAPGLQTLADWGGAGSLVVLDAGMPMQSGGNAAGRRVMLPFGRQVDSNVNWDYINNNGRLIVQRALQWGTGNTGEAPDLIYRDEFTNRNCNAADYTGSDGPLDWSPWAWTEIGDDSGPCGGAIIVEEDPSVIDPGNYRIAMHGSDLIIERRSDLSEFPVAYLSFDYRRDGFGSPPDALVVWVSGDGGSNWNLIDTILGPATDTAYRSVSYDISAFISADTMTRFETTIGNADSAYIDNIQISATPHTPGYNVLLIVGNLTLSSKDVGYKALMESWGHTVAVLDDGASQADYDTAMAAADVIYASGSALGANMLDKATYTTKPVVNEVPGKIDNFGFSSVKSATANFDTYSVTNAAHYITEPFGGNPVTVFTSSLTNPVPGGTLAPDLQNVGQVSATLALGTLDAGATRYDGNPSQGRRAHLPFTSAETTDMTADGKNILQRAIEWAVTPSVPPPPAYAVLLIVGNDTTLASKDVGYKALMESWGHTVAVLDDGASQADYDTAMDAADVVYASGSALGANMLDKATYTTKGVVNEVPGKIDNFGFSSVKSATANFDTFSITDAAHYITEPFGGSPVTVFTSSLTNPVPGGTLAPDLQNVGEVTGTPALGTLEAGATGWNGNPVPARRAHLPFRSAETTDMTEDGKTILQRTIEWAAGAGSGGGGGGGGGGGCNGPFSDTFDAVSYSGGTSNWATNWEETGETTSPSGGDIRIANDTSNYQLQVRDDGQTVWREADLSAATSATLSFDYRRQNLSGSGDYVAVEVSYDGGNNWSELARFTGTATDASYTGFSQPLDAGSLSATTRIRFRTPSFGMSNSNMVWFDNVEITCTP